MADARGLGPREETLAGSSPVAPTNTKYQMAAVPLYKESLQFIGSLARRWTRLGTKSSSLGFGFSGIRQSCSSTQMQPFRSRNGNKADACPSKNVTVLPIKSGMPSGLGSGQGHFDELIPGLVFVLRLGKIDIVKLSAGIYPAGNAIVAAADEW